MYPGVAQLVARLLWEQDAVGSSPATRTKIPLKSLISEGFSYSLSIAAQDLKVVCEHDYFSFFNSLLSVADHRFFCQK